MQEQEQLQEQALGAGQRVGLEQGPGLSCWHKFRPSLPSRLGICCSFGVHDALTCFQLLNPLPRPAASFPHPAPRCHCNKNKRRKADAVNCDAASEAAPDTRTPSVGYHAEAMWVMQTRRIRTEHLSHSSVINLVNFFN